MKINTTIKLFAFIAFCGVLSLWALEAYALRISIKRIIFEGDKRSETITIINNSDKDRTYRMSLRHYTMGTTKGLQRIDEEDLEQYGDINWADDYIRFAPRRFTIEPGGAQQVRVFARAPRNLEDGEYRSHLWILTEVSPEEFSETKKDTGDKPAVRLAMQPGISLPVFLRHGNISSTAALEQGSIEQAQTPEGQPAYVANFRLTKEGEKSIYGNFGIYCTAGSEEFMAKHVKGWAIYSETSYRDLSFFVNVPDGRSADDCRTMRVNYEADEDDETYKGRVIATLDISL